MAWERAFFGALALTLSLLEPTRCYAGAPPKAAVQPLSSASEAPASTPALAPKLSLEGPEMEAKDRARVLFQEGVAAYREGKYYEAVELFLHTQRIYPDTQLCFNVARAYENLGQVSAALRYYREYLRRADRPSDGKEVLERVRKLELQLSQRGVQQLTVLSTPEAATLLLDGRPVGITPWTGESYPGKHRLQLQLAGYVSAEQIVELDPHSAKDVWLSLDAIAAPRTQPSQAMPRIVERRPSMSLASLLTLGAGMALLGGALVAEAVDSDAGVSRTTSFFAGAGLGVSAVGGVMLYFDFAPGKVSLEAAPLSAQHSAASTP